MSVLESAKFTDSDVEFFKDGGAFVHLAFNDKSLIITGVPVHLGLGIANHTANGKLFEITWQNRQVGGPSHDKAEFVKLILF